MTMMVTRYVRRDLGRKKVSAGIISFKAILPTWFTATTRAPRRLVAPEQVRQYLQDTSKASLRRIDHLHPHQLMKPLLLYPLFRALRLNPLRIEPGHLLPAERLWSQLYYLNLLW